MELFRRVERIKKKSELKKRQYTIFECLLFHIRVSSVTLCMQWFEYHILLVLWVNTWHVPLKILASNEVKGYYRCRLGFFKDKLRKLVIGYANSNFKRDLNKKRFVTCYIFTLLVVSLVERQFCNLVFLCLPQKLSMWQLWR